MGSERLTEVLLELLDATKTKKVRWEESGKIQEFRIAFKSGIVLVSTFTDGDNDIWYTASLHNSKGTFIDSASAYSGEQIDMLRDLYDAARSSALDIDSVINGMLMDIKKAKGVEAKDSDPPF